MKEPEACAGHASGGLCVSSGFALPQSVHDVNDD